MHTGWSKIKGFSFYYDLTFAITSRAMHWKRSLTGTELFSLVTFSRWLTMLSTQPPNMFNMPLILPEENVGLRPFLKWYIEQLDKAFCKTVPQIFPFFSIGNIKSSVLLLIYFKAVGREVLKVFDCYCLNNKTR